MVVKALNDAKSLNHPVAGLITKLILSPFLIPVHGQPESYSEYRRSRYHDRELEHSAISPSAELLANTIR